MAFTTSMVATPGHMNFSTPRGRWTCFAPYGQPYPSTAQSVNGLAMPIWHCARFLIAAALVAAWAPFAQAQAHEKRVGEHILRSSTVSSLDIAASSAQAHGIIPGPERGVLNVVVLRDTDGVSQTVAAKVEAQSIAFSGRPHAIALRKVMANGMISYIGSYDYVPRGMLDFRITAQPDGTEQTLSLRYQERMGPR